MNDKTAKTSTDDTEGNGAWHPAPAEDVEGNGGRFPAPVEDVEGNAH